MSALKKFNLINATILLTICQHSLGDSHQSSITASIHDRYVAGNGFLVDDTPVIQTRLVLSNKKISASVWENRRINDGNSSQYDFGINQSVGSVGPVHINYGFGVWNFPESDAASSVSHLNIVLDWSGMSIAHYETVGNGSVTILAAHKSYNLMKGLNFSLTTQVSHSNAFFNSESGISNAMMTGGLSYKLNKTFGVNASVAGQRGFNSNPDLITSGFGVKYHF